MEASIKQLRGAKNLFSYADTDFWNCAFAWSSPWRWGQQRRDKIQDLRKGESADEFLSRIGTVSTRDSLSLPTNLFGFSALPSGYRDETGGFYAAGTSASWWPRKQCGASLGCPSSHSHGFCGRRRSIWRKWYTKPIDDEIWVGRQIHCPQSSSIDWPLNIGHPFEKRAAIAALFHG